MTIISTFKWWRQENWDLIVMLIILQNWGWPGLHQTPNQKQTKRNSKPDFLALPASLQRESYSCRCYSVMFCLPFQAPLCDALLPSSFLAGRVSCILSVHCMKVRKLNKFREINSFSTNIWVCVYVCVNDTELPSKLVAKVIDDQCKWEGL